MRSAKTAKSWKIFIFNKHAKLIPSEASFFYSWFSDINLTESSLADELAKTDKLQPISKHVSQSVPTLYNFFHLVTCLVSSALKLAFILDWDSKEGTKLDFTSFKTRKPRYFLTSFSARDLMPSNTPNDTLIEGSDSITNWVCYITSRSLLIFVSSNGLSLNRASVAFSNSASSLNISEY